MLTRRVLRPLPDLPAVHEIERDHAMARMGLFLCFCLSAIAFSMAVAKLPIRQLGAVQQLQSLGALVRPGSSPAATGSASSPPIVAPSAIVVVSPAAAPSAVGSDGVASISPAPVAGLPETSQPAEASSAAAPSTARAATTAPSGAPTVVPAPAASAKALTPASPAPSKLAASAPPRTGYTVQAGDTLFGIARRYGVTVQALAGANDLSSSATLQVGKKLAVP